ncbi:alpha/beta hydrolase, partial [Agrobacterium sp. S2]|nr:alpha/beta hydrolase [Agrobacterium sp. S2]
MTKNISSMTRRGVLLSAGAAAAAVAISPTFGFAADAAPSATSIEGNMTMAYVTTKDGVEIFYKDWGPKDAQPIVFHHGWPLSSDDWDAQMLFFLSKGFRVVAHDRRGHGRSAQVADGHDMDHYAADAFAVVEALDLKNA